MADESAVRGDFYADIEIAISATALSRFAGAGDFDKLIILYAWHDFDCDRAFGLFSPGTFARSADFIGNLAGAVARGARFDLVEAAKKSAALLFDFSLACAS